MLQYSGKFLEVQDTANSLLVEIVNITKADIDEFVRFGQYMCLVMCIFSILFWKFLFDLVAYIEEMEDATLKQQDLRENMAYFEKICFRLEYVDDTPINRRLAEHVLTVFLMEKKLTVACTNRREAESLNVRMKFSKKIVMSGVLSFVWNANSCLAGVLKKLDTTRYLSAKQMKNEHYVWYKRYQSHRML